MLSKTSRCRVTCQGDSLSFWRLIQLPRAKAKLQTTQPLRSWQDSAQLLASRVRRHERFLSTPSTASKTCLSATPTTQWPGSLTTSSCKKSRGKLYLVNPQPGTRLNRVPQCQSFLGKEHQSQKSLRSSTRLRSRPHCSSMTSSRMLTGTACSGRTTQTTSTSVTKRSDTKSTSSRRGSATNSCFSTLPHLVRPRPQRSRARALMRQSMYALTHNSTNASTA